MGEGWFTPRRLLALFCVLNALIALDRGVVPSNGVNGALSTAETKGYGIQGDFDLSLFQDGLLPALFQVGILLASSIFAQASKQYSAFRLIGVGLALCTVAAIGCGLSAGFISLLLSRAAMGMGQSTVVVLSSPFIDDHSPRERKACWLAIFSLCFPAGYAVGYMYGGLVGAALGWRAVFLSEAVAMAPLAAFCLLATPVALRGAQRGPPGHRQGHGEGQWGQRDAPSDIEELELLHMPKQEANLHSGSCQAAAGQPNGCNDEDSCGAMAVQPSQSTQADSSGGGGSGSGSKTAGLGCCGALGRASREGLAADLRQLAAHPVYLLSVGGMVLYGATLSTLGYYAPKAAREVFGIAPEVGDVTLGIITVCTGVFGTLTGGIILDRMGASLRSALLVCVFGVGAGCAVLVPGFAASRSSGTFFAAMALAQFAMFMTEGPSSAITLWSVPPELRPVAISASLVAFNVLGAVPGPPIMGLLQGHLHNWRLSMAGWSLLLLAACALFTLARLRACTAVDYSVVPLSAADVEGEARGERLQEDLPPLRSGPEKGSEDGLQMTRVLSQHV